MAESASGPTDGAVRESPRRTRRRWAAFLAVAGGVVLFDQLAKAWVDGSFERASRSIPAGDTGGPTEVIGELVRIAKTYNDGAIFGLFEAAAPILAILSILIVGGIGWYEWRHGARVGAVVNLGLALLLGGALGNLIDRVRFGHVIDFIDAGIGSARWFAFNVADAAVSVGILLLLLGALLGDRVAPRTDGEASAGTAAGPGAEGTAASPPGSA